jgi:hypothetical protein
VDTHPRIASSKGPGLLVLFFEEMYDGYLFRGGSIHLIFPGKCSHGLGEVHQENGHIESFHAILSEHLQRFEFYSIEELTANLDEFYTKYNTIRLHASIASLPPLVFWNLFIQGHITSTFTKTSRRVFKVDIPLWELSGNESLRSFPVKIKPTQSPKNKKAAA